MKKYIKEFVRDDNNINEKNVAGLVLLLLGIIFCIWDTDVGIKMISLSLGAFGISGFEKAFKK